MTSNRRGRIQEWLKGFQKTTVEPTVKEVPPSPTNSDFELNNPVDAFYRHKAQRELQALYRFAIQSRSLAIRDAFARASSIKRLGLADLLTVLENLPSYLSDEAKQSLSSAFDGPILLALADLLANTARDDLDTYGAVQLYDFVYSLFGATQFSDQQILLYVEALSDAGDFDRAELLARKHSIGDIAPLHPELLALQRVWHTSASIKDWLAKLNVLYSRVGMTRVRLLEDTTLPPLDRLTAETPLPLDGPKVSIIMPTFSPGRSIYTALRALIEQSWQNLEIIVVDDASPSDSQETFKKISKLDPRIRVIHQPENAGAYVARNAGLAIATGDFVTTADDDDWSHPDKIASQVSLMLNAPEIVATTSAHIRTTEQLEFRRVNSSPKFLQMNYSSLMFPRYVVGEIGGWDTVNRGADSEFYKRVLEVYGSERVAHLADGPYAFSRVRDGSLTSGEMYRGFIGTPRVMYLWATRQWRWDMGRLGQKPTLRPSSPRPYAVPTTLEAGRRNEHLGQFDVILATDFFRQAKHSGNVVTEMESLAESGLRVGYIHLYSPETKQLTGFPRRLFQLQHAKKISQISMNDRADARLLIVYGASVGMFADELYSSITCAKSILVEPDVFSLSKVEHRTPVRLRDALQNLDHAFNTKFKVVGSTLEKQSSLHHSVPATRIARDDYIWHIHLRGVPGDIKPPKEKPIIGFHSYGNHYRWPANLETFRAIYASPQYETRFYGAIEGMVKRYGSEGFTNLRIVDAHKCSESEFLESLDFWLYYPHHRLSDSIWLPVLRAMYAGKVVILPKRLEHIYEMAAIYADPDEISKIVTRLSTSPAEYVAQARRGQDFVGAKFTSEHLVKRVRKLIGERL